MIHVAAIGWKARRLLAGSVEEPTVVAPLSRSLYLDVAGEVVWLGPAGSPLHGRAIIADRIPRVDAGSRLSVPFDLAAAREWRPPAPRNFVAPNVVTASRTLMHSLVRLGRPDGFGVLLAGARPSFPLDGAAGDARAFLVACAAGDPSAASATAERLLGLGPGLTPAGDDLVGGAFFARRLLAEAGDVAAPPWRAAAETIRARAAGRTHRISATLLGDLLDGDGHAPLHDLAAALARSDTAAALGAAARLVRIGHSSGWDLFAGFLGALGALGAPPGR
jgi:hypothetical protein